MKDRKKLIKGLEYCTEAKDKNCPMACPFFKECFSGFTSTEPFYPIMHAVLEFLKEQPDIVRCKDCKNAKILSWLDNAIICKKHSYTGVRPDEFYCADAERRGTND